MHASSRFARRGINKTDSVPAAVHVRESFAATEQGLLAPLHACCQTQVNPPVTRCANQVEREAHGTAHLGNKQSS